MSLSVDDRQKTDYYAVMIDTEAWRDEEHEKKLNVLRWMRWIYEVVIKSIIYIMQ